MFALSDGPGGTKSGQGDAARVVRLAAPAVAQSLLQTLVFLVDRLMLGHHSETSLAAMQTAGPLAWSVASTAGAFGAGTVAVVGRSLGARDSRAAGAAARGSLLLALALGGAVGALCTVFLGPILDVFGGAGAAPVRATSIAYLHIVLPATPVILVGMAAVSVLQAAGDTATPLRIGALANAVNIAGNWVLVFGRFGIPALGARGSAWSTVAAEALQAVLSVAVLYSARSPVNVRAGGSAWDAVRRVVRVSWGAWGERAVYHAAYMAFVGYVTALGSAAMAANQALISIESISFLSADGFAVAAGALVAQRLGAGDERGARHDAWLTAGMCAGLLAAFGLVFLTVPGPLILAFRDDPALVRAGAGALRVAAAAQVPMAVAVVLAQSMRGAGATREAMAVSLLGAALVRLSATWWFVTKLGLGLTGVWLGSTADWVVRALVYALRWRGGRWARAKV